MKAHLILSAALLLPTALFAQEPSAGTGKSPFDLLDANKDLAISAAEAQAHPVVSQNFGAADSDGDRVLTREEFNAAFVAAGSSDDPPAPPPSLPEPE